MKFLSAFALCFFCSLLFSRAAWSQGFSSVDKDLEQLENLINDTLLNTEEQQKQLEDLRANLNSSENLIASYENTIAEQENLLRDLRKQLNEMSETYRMQSSLSAKYEKSSKFWRTFTLIAIPITAVISGGIVYAVIK
jgi:septal ring factor EnvC (AmiA/AmiB activator)